MMPQSPCTRFSLMLFALILCALPAHGGIYKWVDAQGQVHYGEQPAADDAEKVDIKTRPFPKQITRPGETVSDKASKEAAAAEPAAPEAVTEEWVEAPLTRQQKQLLCREARTTLSDIQSSARLRASDGSRRILSPEERQQRIRQLNQDIRAHCR